MIRPHLDQRLRYLGTMSVYNDCHMDSPLDSGELDAALRGDEDDALRDHGCDPDTMTETERIIALEDIITADMKRQGIGA